MRPLHTIAVLLLAAAILLLAAERGAVVGSWSTAKPTTMGHTQHAQADHGVAPIDAAEIDTVPCDHAPTGGHSGRKLRSPCCQAVVNPALQLGLGSILIRDAQMIGPIRFAADPRVPTAHLRGIERPPKQG